MIEPIKEVVQNILEHWGLTDYAEGVVISVAPLGIKVGDCLALTGENFLVACSAQDFAVGDKLLMLRVLRGQKYIILAKAVSA